MLYSFWTCYLFWVGLPTLYAYPVFLSFFSDSVKERTPTSQWERYGMMWIIGILSVTVTVFAIVGCLCCQRRRRPKGFQDQCGKCEQEFKNGTSGQESNFERSTSLELDVPRMITSNERIQFEPLPVQRVLSGTDASTTTKPLPPLSSYRDDHDRDREVVQQQYREWLEREDLRVPREKLKYLREIGRGWFGKVVEGHADLGISKHGGVVVRILTEDASDKEKSWFLGEAIPYLRMQHRNVLALLGFCLETEPHLLLFESCSGGDLKGFLLSNHDRKSREALLRENVPTRMALEIITGLQHMHSLGFAHTDLSARNCLVAADLSTKLGDYGIAVEKYPNDYYIVGDRALPIRWSAPESLECTDTTIETREITTEANAWSYAILLWEILAWGKRPYDDENDEQVIRMLLSMKNADSFLTNHAQILENSLKENNLEENHLLCMLRAIRMCLKLEASERPSLNAIERILCNEQPGEEDRQEDFERRWESLRRNAPTRRTRSASLQDLRGSIDSDYWTSIVDEKVSGTLESSPSFHLGPDEPVEGCVLSVPSGIIHHESGSETEEESWKGQIERGVYTEKVRQKSKSVADLMVLVHIDSDSDAECSMLSQTSEKPIRQKFPATSSDTDLRRITLADEFDEALKRLRDSLQVDASNKSKLLDNLEWPKLLTLTVDQAHTPILRLSLDPKEDSTIDDNQSQPLTDLNSDIAHTDKHVLRLLTKDDTDQLPLLRYIPDQQTSVEELKCKDEPEKINDDTFFKNKQNSDNLCLSNDLETNQNDFVDVVLWNHALDSALERKIPGFSDGTEFNDYTDISDTKSSSATDAELNLNATSVSDTSSNDCRYDPSSTEVETKRPNEDEEERKRLSTPDDEQSSDSGFRDKESCEEEESLCPSSTPGSSNISTTQAVAFTEEEQLKVLFELDTILDAEYYAVPPEIDSLNSVFRIENVELNLKEQSDPENFNNTQQTLNTTSDFTSVKLSVDATVPDINETKELENYETIIEDNVQNNENALVTDNPLNKIPFSDEISVSQDTHQDNFSVINEKIFESQEHWPQGECIEEHEDEDSSTMSLRSDNSYVSFGMEEEFVTAIRNELKEKLPRAQMPVVETSELLDDKNSSITDIIENKVWDDDENEDAADQNSIGLDISIRYNIYGTPLSPILEERESGLTSESQMSNSRDVSTASKETIASEDVLLVDTQTNKVVLLEGLEGTSLQDDDRDTTNDDISEEDNMECSSMMRSSENRLHMKIASGGVPLPSPEEESKWQQLSSPSFPLPLPLPVQDELMSTSFTMDQEWGSQDEEEDDDEEEDEDNSSSSGEFVWKRYNEPNAEQIQIKSSLNSDEVADGNEELEDEMDAEDEEEEEFTPSAWNATLAPHRSALRSPDKAVKSTDQKKSVWFKKQRYHCVYEYPKETLASDNQGQATTTWEPTSYSDWEEMMDEPKLDLYLGYDDAAQAGNEEFYVSSSNRPFQFQTSDTKYVSQFFPGASSITSNDQPDEVDGTRSMEQFQDNQAFLNENERAQHQLGELRHTRDRLKLNLLSSNDVVSLPVTKSNHNDTAERTITDNREILSNSVESKDTQDETSVEILKQDQRVLPNVTDGIISPEVPRDVQPNLDLSSPSEKNIYENGEEEHNSSEKYKVVPCDYGAT